MYVNKELFQSSEPLTFDDALVFPAYSEILPVEADGTTRLTAELRLNISLLLASMDTADTASQARLAIALACEGGDGIIHCNLSPRPQANEVDKVERSQFTPD